ncbi:PQQ-dependent sugar dehydrogenase [Aliiroseovarius crassostreae]|uniref:PQQ-dependent sugar dehydrogenase n=1 Tax=Aliiroseovarius crassostreae TaxID=154981 RepID=UPI00223B1115|nr:PQQ-dependent sugar dehydrogenase [Aliiroseovarius crassostreae]
MKLPFAACIFALMALLVTPAVGFPLQGNRGSALNAEPITGFNHPWAMTFIDQDHLLVTTKPGKLWLVTTAGRKQEVQGLPRPMVGGQGGLGDVVLHPDFSRNRLVYISMVLPGDRPRTRRATVLRGALTLGDTPKLTDLQVIWTQHPARLGKGHFSHRLAFGPKGKLFITSGDRQEQTPAQRWDMALGKIIRLNDDGSVPGDNPFQDKGPLAKSFWTTGHRNLLGLSFDAQGRLWAHEMGPRHGDELNLIEPGRNYGWPIVSDGDHYSGSPIPDHATRPEFEAPKLSWVPSIAPSGLVIYSGNVFPDWQGDALIGGLVSRALIRVDLSGGKAREAERFEWRKRVREVEQGPGGYLWVLEDGGNGRLLKLSPLLD